jgi:hypothetical protein
MAQQNPSNAKYWALTTNQCCFRFVVMYRKKACVEPEIKL